MNWKIRVNGVAYISIISLLIVLVFSFFIFGTYGKGDSPYSLTEQGVRIDKEAVNRVVSLDEGWHFYENALVVSGTGGGIEVTLPHNWNATGYGTYTISIEGLTPGKDYGLYLYDLTSAYKLYINGEEIHEDGFVATSASEESIHWQPRIIAFNPFEQSLELALQVSNYTYFPGGVNKSILFGELEAIIAERERNITQQMIMVGGIVMIAFFNLSLYLLNREERSALYFFFFCMVVAIRVFFTGERLINLWLSEPEWLILIRLQVMVSSLMLGTIYLFMHGLFSDLISKASTLATGIVSGTLFVAGIFLPLMHFMYMDLFYLLVSVTAFIYLMYRLIVGIRKNRQGALLSFLGFVFLLVTVGFDFVLPAGSNIVALGVYIYLLFQSLVLAEKFSVTFRHNQVLHNVAVRDGMTNLFKKDHFLKLVEALLVEELIPTHHGMLFIDIDDFKSVNDTYGHDAGDECIISIAERIIRSLRSADIACRYGGDEFIVWLHDTKRVEAEAIAARILANISEPMAFDGEKKVINASIGISMYPEDDVEIEKLVKMSDAKMYEAKKAGKHQYR